MTLLYLHPSYVTPDKYIEVISSMYKNSITALRIGNEVSNWFCNKSGVKQGCVLSVYMYHLNGLSSKEQANGNERANNQVGR